MLLEPQYIFSSNHVQKMDKDPARRFALKRTNEKKMENFKLV